MMMIESIEMLEMMIRNMLFVGLETDDDDIIINDHTVVNCSLI